MGRTPNGNWVVTCHLAPELREKAKKNNIGWTEALRTGIGVLLAEKGDPEFLSPRTAQMRILRLTELIAKLSRDLEDLKNGAR